MRPERRSKRRVFAAGLSALLCVAAAHGADITANWQSGNGSWFDATKWSSNPLIPNNGGFTYNAVFPVTGTVIPSYLITTSQNITVEKLLLEGSFYRLASNASNSLTINDTFQLKGGLENWGQVTAKGTLLMEPRTSPGTETFINNTTFNIDGSATWAAGEFQTSNTTINIASAASLDIQGDVLFDRDGVGFETSILNNAGLIKKSAGDGTARITQDLVNTGTVEAQSGTLQIERGSNTGTIRALPGASILFDSISSAGIYSLGGTFDAQTLRVGGNGRVTVQSGTIFQNVQAIDVQKGTLTINRGAPTTVASFSVAGLFAGNEGIVTTADQITVTGNTLLQGGKLTGGGKLIAGGSTIIETLQFQLNNFSVKFEGPTVVRTKIENVNSTLEITPTITLDIENDSDITGGVLINAGTLRKTTGSGESQITGSITHTGSIQVLSGTLEVNGVSTFSGPIGGNASAVIDFTNGNSTLKSGSSITNIAATVTDSGVLIVDANAHVTARSIKLSSVAGGTLRLAAGSQLTLLDGLTIETGTLTGVGTLIGDVNSAARVIPGTTNADATIAIDGDLDQNATGIYFANIRRSSTLGAVSDLLDISGQASIAGEIRVTATGSLLDGDQFTILLADHIANNGFTLIQPTLSGGRSITWAILPIADRDALILTVVPEPSTTLFTCTALFTCLLRGRRR